MRQTPYTDDQREASRRRDVYRKGHLWCAICLAEGKEHEMATEVHHLAGRRTGKKVDWKYEDPRNFLPVGPRCHDVVQSTTDENIRRAWRAKKLLAELVPGEAADLKYLAELRPGKWRALAVEEGVL